MFNRGSQLLGKVRFTQRPHHWGSWVNLGLVGLAESVLLLGAWGDGTVSSVRNAGFLQSEGETLPGLEFHLFCVCDWLVDWFLSWIILFTENSVSR